MIEIKRKYGTEIFKAAVSIALTKEEVFDIYNKVNTSNLTDKAKEYVEIYINKNNAKLTIGDVNLLSSSYKEISNIFMELKNDDTPDKITWNKAINTFLNKGDLNNENNTEENFSPEDIHNCSSEWEQDQIRFNRGYS